MTEYRITGDTGRTIPGHTTTTENNHHNRSSTGTGTSTGARARTREEAEARGAMLHGMYVDCCEYYTRTFRRSIPFVVQREIAERIRDGMSPDVIRTAMDETQTAPRPSWAYCRAILRRCDIEGIKTMADWRASKERFQASKNPALNYEQRNYTDDDFKDFFIDFSMEQGGEQG